MSNDKITRREFIERTTLTVASATVLPSALESEAEAQMTLPRVTVEDRIKAKIKGPKVTTENVELPQTPETSHKKEERFEWIVTARVGKSEYEALNNKPFVISLNASRRLRPFLEKTLLETCAEEKLLPKGEKTNGGKGVIVGIVDFGLDFAHRNFRNGDSTRILALWDQKAKRQGGSIPNRFGYGRVFSREEITEALETSKWKQGDPNALYDKLGYLLPKDSMFDTGAHGTYVADVAAGNGAGTNCKGVAPEAGIVFVDLATVALNEPPAVGSTFGDSAQLLEAIQFIFEYAKDRPCVVNLSVGSNDGPHDGTTLVEEAIDWLVSEKPNRAVVVAAGNAVGENLHATGLVREGGAVELKWRIPPYDATRNEMELWYPGKDRRRVDILDPDGKRILRVNPGEQKNFGDSKRGLLTVYNILGDPGNGDNVINVFFERGLRKGVWTLRLYGKEVRDGRFHAWIERDERGQSRFAMPDDGSYKISDGHTLSSLACGKRTIVVGAYDAHDPKKPISDTSGSGPTRDGRRKPDLSAPGVLVLAAQSGTRALRRRQSGTSMAAPAVTGIVALMLAEAKALGLSLTAEQIRNILILASHNDLAESNDWDERSGYGRVCAAKTVALVSALAFKCQPAAPPV